MAITESSILEVEVEVNRIVQDLRERVTKIYDRYTDKSNSIPKLPDYNILIKDDRLCYSLAKNLTDCIDELNEVKLRITVVLQSLSDIANTQAPSRSEYKFMSNLKNNIKRYEDELSEYKFDIMSLTKNANNKLRVIESLPFYN